MVICSLVLKIKRLQRLERFLEDGAVKLPGCPYLRMDANEKNAAARRLYARLGYKEIGIVDCEFNGIAGVHLVCLEKSLLT